MGGKCIGTQAGRRRVQYRRLLREGEGGRGCRPGAGVMLCDRVERKIMVMVLFITRTKHDMNHQYNCQNKKYMVRSSQKFCLPETKPTCTYECIAGSASPANQTKHSFYGVTTASVVRKRPIDGSADGGYFKRVTKFKNST